jgi:hypothetical protein
MARPIKELGPKFVSSKDIPEHLSEALAAYRHKNECGAFDGGRNRAVAPPPFRDQHRASDVLRASIILSNVCNTFGLPLSELEQWVPVRSPK